MMEPWVKNFLAENPLIADYLIIGDLPLVYLLLQEALKITTITTTTTEDPLLIAEIKEKLKMPWHVKSV